MIDIDNNDIFDVFLFPGGEYGIKYKIPVKTIQKHITLFSRLRSGNDIIKLLTVTDALKRLRILIDLYIPYLHGGRQDRIANEGEPLTIKVFADLINAQNYNAVHTLDPHSDTSVTLINNCVVSSVDFAISQFISDYDVVFVPDAGAAKKIHNYYLKDSRWDGQIVQCLKTRDTKTGKLSGFQVVNPYDMFSLMGKNAVIIDDVCDGGGTFIGLAQEIRRLHPTVKTLSLYTTHGIYSKGVRELYEHFDYIMTTDSFRSEEDYKDRIPSELAGAYSRFKVFQP